MFGGDDAVPPEERRGPLGGSSTLWWGVVVALLVLVAGLVLPTLGEGRSRQEVPFDRSPAPSGPVELPRDDDAPVILA